MERMARMTCELREIKATGDGSEMTFEGYGAVFNNVDHHGDVIEPGAFAAFLADVKSRKQQWPAMLAQHGGWGMTSTDMTPVGVYTEMAEDGTGLHVKGKFAKTARGEELYELSKMTPRPAINGMSIGFIPKEFERGSKPTDPRNKFKRIDVLEISLVTFPANPKARVSSVKSIDDLGTIRDAESFLIDECGMPKSMAVAFIGKIKGIGPGDPAGPGGAPGDPDAGIEEIKQLLKTRGELLGFPDQRTD